MNIHTCLQRPPQAPPDIVGSLAYPGAPPRALPTLITCCCDSGSFPKNLLLVSPGTEMMSKPRTILISKSRSCDDINAAGHSYQQVPPLRSYQRCGPLLSARPEAAITSTLWAGTHTDLADHANLSDYQQGRFAFLVRRFHFDVSRWTCQEGVR